MSVTVNLTFEGPALGEIPSRDVAEHICKLVEDELRKVGNLPGGSGSGYGAWEEKHSVETRPFLSDTAFSSPSAVFKVVLSGYYHVPDADENVPDTAPEAPPAP